MSFDSTINAKAVELVKLSYEMTAAAGSGHPTSAASLGHIVTVLMYQHMRWEPANPTHPCSDRLVLSEGHAVPVVYAACADLRVMVGKGADNWQPLTREMLLTLRAIDSPLDGHPNPAEGFPFFDAATGSLGQGLSVAAGLGAAARMDGIDRRVYCIIGDGESREGQIWEAVDQIRDHRLTNVCGIFNANVYAQSDRVSAQQSPEMLAEKLRAYGFVVELIDGHNPTAVRDALSRHAQRVSDPDAEPMMIVARTVKGWGSASQQGHGHHGKPAAGDELTVALAELDETGRGLGAAADMSLTVGLISGQKPPAPRIGQAPSLTDALGQFGMTALLEGGKLATRKAYGVALRALGLARDDVVALDADVKNSTFAEYFAQDEQLAPRYIECRIAEQNMISMASGLSAAGKIPFASTFGKFVARAYDQIEMAVNSGANFKVVGSHCGVSLAADGPSQMALNDVAFFSSFARMTNHRGQPGFYLLQPSDAFQAYALTMAMAEHDGPCYMRTFRPDVEFLYSDEHQFELGGHEVLMQGRDLLIIASGYMVHQANRVLERLDGQGIDATLVDLYSIPFDQDAILDLANQNNGMVLTLEDNYGGGIGSAVADAVSADGGGFNVCQMYVKRIPKSGRTADEVLTYCGLGVEQIVAQVLELLGLNT